MTDAPHRDADCVTDTMAAEGFTMIAVLPDPSGALGGVGARQEFRPTTPHSLADTPIPGPMVADKGLLCEQ